MFEWMVFRERRSCLIYNEIWNSKRQKNKECGLMGGEFE